MNVASGTHIEDDPWLTDVMGRPVYRLRVGDLPDMRVLGSHLEGQSRAFYYLKVGCDRVEVVRQLGAQGFSVVDTNLVFRLDRVPAPESLPPDLTITDSVAEVDQPALLEIGTVAFQWTRFHLDGLIPNEIASRIKREWVRSLLQKKRGDRMFVARSEDRPVGFLGALANLATPPPVATIDLIGVAPAYQRRRVGRALARAFIDHYRHQVDALEVGTQVANVASVRFYESLGFSLARSEYVLHLHVEDGRPRS